ncbi:hypothetical protein FR483_n667L [Paramecium bursaria Chlorella virus FR483]|uniref:Uncharacterized protein n667L n=1 Tax=Paramecium bursaria Chlorella virus FR483 TaxID=399781 RepID=A7J821_PBCVF|nr:hypothetical protein FR483_n667L [Paramecium bursaria Chlorella virus FR483]ABT15952.1 hypothetical protein FR483_n667L [Paramecium bursaria Chlorella virus FR483]
MREDRPSKKSIPGLQVLGSKLGHLENSLEPLAAPSAGKDVLNGPDEVTKVLLVLGSWVYWEAQCSEMERKPESRAPERRVKVWRIRSHLYIYITLTFYYTFPRSFPLLSCLSLTNLVMARDAIAFLRLDIKNLSWSFSS